MPRLRVMLLGWGLFLLAFSGNAPVTFVLAQVKFPPAPPDAGTDSARGLPLVDRSLKQRLTNARELIKNGKLDRAVPQIQSILNLPQDGLYAPDDELAGRLVSLKQQAELTLRQASPELLRAYELQFGTEARRLFVQAAEQRNPAQVEEVMRRYLHTAAGADAVYWLGLFHQDRADYDTALQCFARLNRLPAAARFEPELSLRNGLCQYRTGRVDKALALIRAAAAGSKNPLKLAGYELADGGSDSQILAWLKATSPAHDPVKEPSGWLMARGNAERNLLFRSSPPLGKSLWNVSQLEWTVPDDQSIGSESTLSVKPQIAALASIHADKAISPLPASTPLVVNDVVVARFLDHLAGFDLRTGQELWRSAENDRIFQYLHKHLDDKESSVGSFSNRNKSPREMYSLLLRQRTWEDLTYGTLSSDGELVFSIEDLGFLNDIHIPPTMAGAASEIQRRLIMRDFNRLCAYEAKTGKLKWELGGPRGEIMLPQAGTFFLGPPLAVDHQLMCLVEDQGLVHLLVLDSRSGKALWTQELSQAVDNLVREPSRRRAGLTPVLLGDLLVCPTGNGLVVTIDMASRSHVWAYQYAAPVSANGRDPRMIIRMQMAMRGVPSVDMDLFRGAEVNEWQDGGPLIAEGHVLLTPRDSAELHCLSLEDGKVAWRVPRKDGLYVAAVQSGLVIVASTRSVEALHLVDGKPAWPLPVPLINQAGRGIVTEGQILLPLVTGEVASIDLKSGQVLSRSRVHEAALLGNLIPGQGFIVSQSATNLAVFRTLDSISVETAARLKQNPQDAEALALRGEFRLSQGDVAGGQADLRESLKLHKSADTQSVLFESLVQKLQLDFAGSRSQLGEIEQLAEMPGQRVTLYRVWAEGLLAAREYRPAFGVLLKLGDSDLGNQTLDRLGGYRSMRRDHWIRTQLHDMLQNVDEPTRAFINAEIHQRLTAALMKKNADALRSVIRHFGSHPLADDVRLALAELLVASEYSVEAEQLLSQLSLRAQPPIAGHALAVMIRESIKLDHAEECVELLERLAVEFAEVVCLNNKTGRQLAEGWLPQVQAQVPFAVDWPTGRVDAAREIAPVRQQKWVFEVPIDGDAGPVFRHSQFLATQEGDRLVGLNGRGKLQWAIPWNEIGAIANFGAYRAQVRNHLVLLTAGRQVSAVSTLMSSGGARARVLWNSPLVEGAVGDEDQFLAIQVNRVGMIRPLVNRIDFQQNPLGNIAAVDDDSVVIQRGRHLVLADLLTGEPLWKRTDLIPGSEIFGDSEVIVVVPPDKSEGQIIRRLDGITIRDAVPVAPPALRIMHKKGSLLAFGRDPTKRVLRLQLDDLPNQKQTWSREFELASHLAVVSQNEIAVLQPAAGTLSLVRVADGTVLWEEKLTLASNLKDLWVIPNGDRLLVMNGEIPARNFNRQVTIMVQNNQILMDAQAECLDRATGKSYWTRKIDQLALDYTLPQYLPCWIFSILSSTPQPPNAQKTEFQTMAIDKRSGQIVLKSKEEAHIGKYQVVMDQSEKVVRIFLNGVNETIVHKLKYTDEPVDTPAANP